MTRPAGGTRQLETDSEALAAEIYRAAGRSGVRQDHTLYAVVMSVAEAVRHLGRHHEVSRGVLGDATRRIEAAVTSAATLTDQQVERARLQTVSKLTTGVIAGIEDCLKRRADTERRELWCKALLTVAASTVFLVGIGFAWGKYSSLVSNEAMWPVVRAEFIATSNHMATLLPDGSRDARFWLSLVKINNIEQIADFCRKRENVYTVKGRRACKPPIWMEPAGQPMADPADWDQ